MSFRESLPLTLHFEGGYAHDPDDPGGATMKGITQRVYDGWRDAHQEPRQSVRGITDEEVAAIYRVNYWDAAGCHVIEQLGKPKLAQCVFDWAVNGGAWKARVFLQVAVGARPDGIIGGETTTAVGSADDLGASRRYLEYREWFHRARAGDFGCLQALRLRGMPAKALPTPNATQAKFLRTWLARVDRLRAELGITA